MTDATVIGVYRHRNADTMARIVEDAEANGWPVALWALDTVADALEPHTKGHGPGAKFALLNRLLDAAPIPSGSHLVVTDDDVALVDTSLSAFLDVAVAAGLGLAQPAHARGSHDSHPITRRRRATKARLTTYIEMGPLFAVAPAWLPRVVPFPEDMGMGWGIELLWSDLRTQGCRLGIVDAAAMRHLELPGRTYDMYPETVRLLSMLEDRGIESLGDLQRTLASWRPWQPTPPWAA